MYQVGDFVFHTTNGVCRIDSLTMKDFLNNGDVKEYFVLIPVCDQTGRVYIRTDQADVALRDVITEGEALKLIDAMSEVSELDIENEKVRELRYKEALRSGDPTHIVMMIKTLRNRRALRREAGKKSTATDDYYIKIAEDTLFSELAFALGRERTDVCKMINEKVGLCVN